VSWDAGSTSDNKPLQLLPSIAVVSGVAVGACYVVTAAPPLPRRFAGGDNCSRISGSHPLAVLCFLLGQPAAHPAAPSDDDAPTAVSLRTTASDPSPNGKGGSFSRSLPAAASPRRIGLDAPYCSSHL